MRQFSDMREFEEFFDNATPSELLYEIHGIKLSPIRRLYVDTKYKIIKRFPILDTYRLIK